MEALAILCTLILAAGLSAEDALPWWKTAILYQVYPRSFMDSDGDGIGDLAGITDRAQYFKDIGVTAIWLSPFYKSPMKDFGYDVSDYRDVEPTFGTMDDFRDLAKRLRELDVKLLVDIVPNHASDQHEWFQKSIEKIDPYTDYFIWNDGKEVDGKRVPPNNWLSVFEGSAWTWNEKRKQFYLHQFLPEQPDLNYWNPKVVKELDDLLTYWLDEGVDGFRVDANIFLFEDKELRDEILIPGRGGEKYADYYLNVTTNRPESYDLLKRWAQLVLNYSKKDGRERAMWLEGYTDMPHTFQYQGHGDLLLMQPFNFILVGAGDKGTRAEEMLKFINIWLKEAPSDNVNNWVLENHDNPRVPDKRGPEMVAPMMMLTGVLPGVKCMYYGEELGMSGAYIRWDQTVDLKAIKLGPDHFQEVNRDPVRTPMQWDNSLNAGFSSSLKTWLPVNPNYYYVNVAQQLEQPVSNLKTLMALAQARKDPILQRGTVTARAPNNDTLLVIRQYNSQHMVLVINMGSEVMNYTSANLFRRYGVDANSTVIVSSLNSGIPVGTRLKIKAMSLVLVPKSAVLLRSGYATDDTQLTTATPSLVPSSPPSQQTTDPPHSTPPPTKSSSAIITSSIKAPVLSLLVIALKVHSRYH